ncbi:DUF2238 domain-containing protein [Nibribacter ruber]|uniref:DUF2238 domain-containing protein n=1 Tax=Nibribacter ruber TaxID=2698458 RepID=A0A6P1NZG0_9BACT|nr:DUF2238 domain-containing protein [Nibribacter ruber]QHL87378.1 DUF2238 domain-containing protein [Nibribacter ruber]
MPYSFALDPERTHFRKNLLLIVYVLVFLGYWAYTGFNTPDLKNWWLENTLTFSAIILLAAFYRHFQFSDFSYTCMFLFLMLHVYGSQYTYSENPFGYWVKDELGLARNHYDRLVHFGFGFLLAYPMYEVFRHLTKMRPLFAFLLPIELTISMGAFYELIEWAVADVFFPAQGMAYLGTQGDVWDAQKDIAIAMLGAAITMGSVFLGSRFSTK